MIVSFVCKADPSLHWQWLQLSLVNYTSNRWYMLVAVYVNRARISTLYIS